MKRRGEIGKLWGVPTETGEWMLGEPWKTRVHVLSNKKEETQSIMKESICEARSLALRVEASAFSKPVLMSRKRLETRSLGLWRVLTSCVRARQGSVEVRPGREPHWLGWRRPLDLAMADNLTAMTCSRIGNLVFNRTMMRKEAVES